MKRTEQYNEASNEEKRKIVNVLCDLHNFLWIIRKD